MGDPMKIDKPGRGAPDMSDGEQKMPVKDQGEQSGEPLGSNPDTAVDGNKHNDWGPIDTGSKPFKLD